MPDADRQHELDLARATGARWISLDIDWASIQGDGPTSFRWDRSTDTVVREARARGLKVLGMLAYSPAWAAPGCPDSHCLPANPQTYADFARAAVQRYGRNSYVPELRGAIKAWQIWNEPNHGPFVHSVNVVAYTELLKRSYASIKAADARARVITGGTSPAGDVGYRPGGYPPGVPLPTDLAPATFLRELYKNGAKGYFDAVAHHPYSYPYSPLYNASWNSFTQTQTLRDVMVANGDAAKKIWGTEAGIPTGAAAGSSVTPAQQAQMVVDYFNGWNVSYRAWTGPLFWFQVRDSGPNRSVIEQNLGLVYRNARWTPKPAYATFQQQVARRI